MKYPHFFPVTRKCNNPSTRLRMEKTYQSRCMKENTEILEEIVTLRQKEAKLLGYENHAAYIQEIRMAKNPETVKKFLGELAEKLQPLWEEEQKVLLEMKEAECKELGLEFSGKLDFWDFRYYMAMVEEKQYAVDQEKLKEYFPMEVITAGLMDIYQKILGLKFTRLEEGEVWHEDVEMWKVDDLETGENVGYFYLDLYPRDGKYGHACMMQLQPACLDKEGERQKSDAGELGLAGGITQAHVRPLQGRQAAAKGNVGQKNANARGFNLRQVFLATFDQRLHTMDTTPDTAQLVRDSYKEIVGIEPIEGTNFAAIFGHLGKV